LLFGREFPFDEVLVLWDGLFAEDPNLTLVDWVCTAMLIFMRKERKYFSPAAYIEGVEC
jgi:TBC1 domain family protein 5